MTRIPFVKMEGLGNDYVYVDGAAHPIADPAGLAPRIADRHFGVGGDGLILVLPPDPGVDADVRMRMFNADGSESEMCGNGVRCVCKFAHDRGLARTRPMRVQTGNGVLSLDYELDVAGRVAEVEVDMGAPRFAPSEVPYRPEALPALVELVRAGPIGERLDGDGDDAILNLVSMGNPHLVIFARDLPAIPLERIGPALETHAAFPRRINVHLVDVRACDEVAMRTWERGSGITLACGTGASAVCVACARRGRTDRAVRAHLPGGELRLRWDEATDHVLMTGPARAVFEGTYAEGDAPMC